jgi:hypothetical protein
MKNPFDFEAESFEAYTGYEDKTELSEWEAEPFEYQPQVDACSCLDISKPGSLSRSSGNRQPHELEGEVKIPLVPPSMRIVRCDQARCKLAISPAESGPQRGREYVRWVQRALNSLLGLRLSADGIIGRKTRSAIRSFQLREGLLVTGDVNQQTERRLIERTGSPSPRNGLELEAPAVAAVSAGAAAIGAGIQLVKFGFEIIKTVVHGEIRFTGPTSDVGIRAINVAPSLPLEARRCETVIIDFEDVSPVGVEQVNVKLRCMVQYDGINLAARFVFDPEGRRSRLMRDTFITVHEPLSLEKRTAPNDWQRCGVTEYGVLRIPVEFRVDRPWPLSNYNENFVLVLSTIFGFGASVSDRQHIKDQRVAWT